MVIVKWTGTVKSSNNLKGHLKYIGFRARDGEKGFFDENKNIGADFKLFEKDIMNDKALRHSESVKAHKFIFSLRADMYKEYQKSGKDFKDLFRKTIKKIETNKNLKFKWIAAFHNDEKHPHVHVVLKGVGKDKNNDNVRLYFNKDDFKNIRETFGNEYNKDVGKNYQYNLSEEKLDKIDKISAAGLKIISGTLEQTLQKIKKDMEREQLEREREK